MTPAEELRTAAKTLREKVAAVREEFRTSFYWGHGEVTWADGINNACGGAGGELAALFAPAAAESLAAWLEATAAEIGAYEYGTVEGTASKKVHPVSPLGIGLSPAREDWTAALAVARSLNGGGPTVWDDSIPPGGEVCAAITGPGRICGTPVESEPCPDHGGAQ